MSSPDLPPWMKIKRVCEYFSIGETTARKTIVPHLVRKEIGSAVLYSRQSVLAYESPPTVDGRLAVLEKGREKMKAMRAAGWNPNREAAEKRKAKAKKRDFRTG